MIYFRLADTLFIHPSARFHQYTSYLIMGLDDVFGFDSYEYKAKVSDRRYYGDEQLANNIYRKRQQATGSAFGVGAGIALAPHTGGATLAGALYSGRNRSVAKQKLNVLEQEWHERGWQQLPTRVRDTAVPIAIGAAAMGVTAGVAYGIDHAGAAAINHAATNAQAPATYGAPGGYTPYGYTEQATASVAGQMAALHAGSFAASHLTGMGAQKYLDEQFRGGYGDSKH